MSDKASSHIWMSDSTARESLHVNGPSLRFDDSIVGWVERAGAGWRGVRVRAVRPDPDQPVQHERLEETLVAPSQYLARQALERLVGVRE